MRRLSHIGLGILCGLLAFTVGAELFANIDAPLPASDTIADSDAEGSPGQQDADSLVVDILARPVFAEDRKPPPEPALAADDAPAGPVAPQLTARLAGITIGPGDSREAVFAEEGQKPEVVHPGDSVSGWRIVSIEADHVSLTSAFGDKELKPTFGTPGEPAKVPVPKPAHLIQPAPDNPPLLQPEPGKLPRHPLVMRPARPPVAQNARQPSMRRVVTVPPPPGG